MKEATRRIRCVVQRSSKCYLLILLAPSEQEIAVIFANVYISTEGVYTLVLSILIVIASELVVHCPTGEVVLKGRRFWEKVKSSDLLNHEWFHLQEQDSLRVSSPVLAL